MKCSIWFDIDVRKNYAANKSARRAPWIRVICFDTQQRICDLCKFRGNAMLKKRDVLFLLHRYLSWVHRFDRFQRSETDFTHPQGCCVALRVTTSEFRRAKKVSWLCVKAENLKNGTFVICLTVPNDKTWFAEQSYCQNFKISWKEKKEEESYPFEQKTTHS